MVEAAEKFTRPDSQRPIDISYRGRPLPFYLGKGALEKMEIAEGFLARANGYGLNLDIKTGEEDRIYGIGWYEFLSKSKGVLGVESGVSFCDIEDQARPAIEDLLRKNPTVSFDEVFEKVLLPWEGNIPIRTISPRHFEAAILRVCQILYEGEYAGILKPMEHYIPLKKDFSNFDEVIRLFLTPEFRTRITENTYRDLIASGQYTYKKFVNKTDQILEENGFIESEPPDSIAAIRKNFGIEEKRRLMLKVIEHRLRYSKFFQKIVKPLLRPILIKVGIFHPEG
jgi:hypothetical protein